MVNAIKERFDKPVRVKGNEVVLTINLFYFVNNKAFYNSDLYNNFITRTLSAINFKDSNCIELGEEFMERVKRYLRKLLKNKDWFIYGLSTNLWYEK